MAINLNPKTLTPRNLNVQAPKTSEPKEAEAANITLNNNIATPHNTMTTAAKAPMTGVAASVTPSPSANSVAIEKLKKELANVYEELGKLCETEIKDTATAKREAKAKIDELLKSKEPYNDAYFANSSADEVYPDWETDPEQQKSYKEMVEKCHNAQQAMVEIDKQIANINMYLAVISRIEGDILILELGL